MSITKSKNLIQVQRPLTSFNTPLIADLNNDGLLDYLTTTTEIGSNTGEPVRLYLSNSQGTYTNRSDLILGGFTSLWTQKILAADLNNDGLQDVVLGTAPEQENSRTENGVGTNTANHLNWGSPQYVLIQNEDGTFTPLQTIATTYEAHSINVADFNNDGFKDILYVSDVNAQSNGQIPKLLLNTGHNSFTDADLSSIIGTGATAGNFRTFYATVGDFNNDNNQDIVFLQGGYQQGAYTFIALGNGRGGFTRGSQLPMVPDSMGGEAATEEGDAVLDLNYDGYLDLIVCVVNRRDNLGDLSPTHLQILINDGQGQFTDQTTQWLGNFATTTFGISSRLLQSYIPGTPLIPLSVSISVKGSSNGYLQEPIFLYNTGSKLISIYDPYWDKENSSGNGFNFNGIQWRLENGKITTVYDDWNGNLVSATLNPSDELTYYRPHDAFVVIDQDSRTLAIDDGLAFSTEFYRPWTYAMPSYVKDMERELLQNIPGNRILLGTKDNDFISVGNAYAGTGNNVLIGNGGNDALLGGSGNDIFIPSSIGTTYVYGGSGNDTVVLSQSKNAYTITGSDTVYSIKNGSVTYTLENITYVRFGDQTLDLITQAVHPNAGLSGINYVNDYSSALVVANTTFVGNDTSNTLVVNGISSNFSISDSENVETLIDNTGALGKEFLINIESIQFTDQTITIGVASIKGTASKDKIAGTTDDDEIYGYAGNDTVSGLAGNDTLDGGLGNDGMVGGIGNDTYYIDATKDVVTEKANEGTDTVVSTATYTLANNIENLTLSGSSAINATGNTSNNTIIGSEAVNSINGGLGKDTLTGGDGNDTFVFNTKIGPANVDTLTDFAPGTDKIALDDAIFSKLKGLSNLADNLYIQSIPGISTQDSNDYLFYDFESGRLYYDADGSGTKSAAVMIAIVGSATEITAADFVVI